MVFFSLSCGIFLYFLRTVWFLLKICTYILDNTLMIVRLKIFIGVLPFAWCWFWVCFFLGGGEGGYIFSTFLYFLKKNWYVSWNFMKFCVNILGITVAIKHKIIWHVAFILEGYFELCYVTFLHIIQFSLPWETPNIPLFCTDFLVSKGKK